MQIRVCRGNSSERIQIWRVEVTVPSEYGCRADTNVSEYKLRETWRTLREQLVKFHHKVAVWVVDRFVHQFRLGRA